MTTSGATVELVCPFRLSHFDLCLLSSLSLSLSLSLSGARHPSVALEHWEATPGGSTTGTTRGRSNDRRILCRGGWRLCRWWQWRRTILDLRPRIFSAAGHRQCLRNWLRNLSSTAACDGGSRRRRHSCRGACRHWVWPQFMGHRRAQVLLKLLEQRHSAARVADKNAVRGMVVIDASDRTARNATDGLHVAEQHTIQLPVRPAADSPYEPSTPARSSSDSSSSLSLATTMEHRSAPHVIRSAGYFWRLP